jgi:Zn-dependent peptidase ImmA (M78 family)
MIAIFPEIMAATANGDVEKLAILARKYFGGKDRFRPAPDMRSMCESAGLAFDRVPLEVHGMLAARDEKGTATVAAFVNRNLPPDEERFLLAHMLGHFFFEMMPRIATSEWSASGFRETTSPLKRFCQNISYDQNRSVELARELVADRFAGAVLMPVAMVIKAAEKIGDPDRLAAFFNVTRPCLQRRLLDCGLVGSMPVSFMDAEQQLRAEQKTVRPDSDEPEVVIPVEKHVSKSAASASYGKTGGGAGPSTSVKQEKLEKLEKQATPGRGSLKGMDRIREIARKLDKGGGAG